MASVEVQVKSEDGDANHGPPYTSREYITGWRLYVIITW